MLNTTALSLLHKAGITRNQVENLSQGLAKLASAGRLSRDQVRTALANAGVPPALHLQIFASLWEDRAPNGAASPPQAADMFDSTRTVSERAGNDAKMERPVGGADLYTSVDDLKD